MTYAVRTPAQLASVLLGQRRALRLTQQQAAAAVGLLPKTVSKLERSPSGATLDSLFKLLSALELELVLQPRNDPSTVREW